MTKRYPPALCGVIQMRLAWSKQLSLSSCVLLPKARDLIPAVSCACRESGPRCRDFQVWAAARSYPSVRARQILVKCDRARHRGRWCARECDCNIYGLENCHVTHEIRYLSARTDKVLVENMQFLTLHFHTLRNQTLPLHSHAAAETDRPTPTHRSQ